MKAMLIEIYSINPTLIQLLENLMNQRTHENTLCA